MNAHAHLDSKLAIPPLENHNAEIRGDQSLQGRTAVQRGGNNNEAAHTRTRQVRPKLGLGRIERDVAARRIRLLRMR